MTRPLRVAIIGAGPAGIYAADILSKRRAESGEPVSIDLIERLPAPYGLVRYGVAPDHPRIKGIVSALHQVLDKDGIRLLGNVAYGEDLKLEDLRHFYDAVVFATGCERDADLAIPGIDLPGSYGAADFVSWYDGHPDVPREWPLEAREIAVIGAGNVALDVARMLAKHPDDLLPTEIPDNVSAGLAASPVTDVHVFGRRGIAQAKFTPLELRELGHVPNVDIVVYPEDFDLDEGSLETIRSDKQAQMVVKTLQNWTLKDPTDAPRRLHLHFLHRPVEVLGEDGVTGLRTERNKLAGDGSATGTGEFHHWDVQAVYRAVGYFGTPLVDLPFDERRGVIPNEGGRVLDLDGEHVPGVYTTGWIKRGPVGLIGHTKGDALETVENLLADWSSSATERGTSAGAEGDQPGSSSSATERGTSAGAEGDQPGSSSSATERGTSAGAGSDRTGQTDSARLAEAPDPSEDGVLRFLDEKNVAYTTWDGWGLLDAHERSLGAAHRHTRERVKVVSREEMATISRGEEP